MALPFKAKRAPSHLPTEKADRRNDDETRGKYGGVAPAASQRIEVREVMQGPPELGQHECLLDLGRFQAAGFDCDEASGRDGRRGGDGMCNRREQAVSVLPRLVDAGPRFITDRVERVVFPLGSAGEEDNAFSVRDEHRLAGLGPIRFQSRKVQLHHYDACRTTFGTRPLRKKIPWYARSDADAVETSSAICQRLPKIRTESIRDSD